MKDKLTVIALCCLFGTGFGLALVGAQNFQTSDPAKNPALTPAVHVEPSDAVGAIHMILTNTNTVVIKFGCGVIKDQPYVDRVEWRTETNRVDTARTSPIVKPGEENLLVYRAATIHYTETVWSNLTAIVVYDGKEFPVVVEQRLAWTENKSRMDGLPVVMNAKGHAEVSALTNIISGLVLTNQWGVGR